jgi:trigger factor
MQFTLTTTTGLERRLEVAIPHARVAGEVESRLREYARTASLKGFRPGKVPFNVIQKQFGGQARSDVVSDLIREGYSEAVSKENLRPAGGPRIEPLELGADGQDLKFAAIFEVMPEVALKPVEEIALERTVAEVTDADVDAMIESMRKQRTEYREVTRAAQTGDRVTADFLGRVDGTPFAGGEGKDTPFVLGSGRAIPDFETALTGMAPGESKTAPVKFPEQYGATELAGKQTEFDLTVKKVEEPVLPPIDDDFAVSFGLAEGGVAQLREEVRKSMEREVSEAVRGKLRAQVFDALVAANPVDLPAALVDEQVQELQIDMMQRAGIRDAKQAPSREPFVEPARRRVALGLLIGELIRRESLSIDRDRVNTRLDELASAYPNAEEIRRAYLQSPDAMRQIETSVLEDQAVDWIVSRAKVTDKPAAFSDVTGFGRQQ